MLLLMSMFIMRIAFVRTVAEQPEQPEQFWLDAGLLSITWKQGCLTTGGCADPRFRIIEAHSVTNEKVSVSWPITENLVEEHSRLFVSHWNKGVPEDLSLSCEVAGTDPTYGFPRICDSSPAIRMFQVITENAVGFVIAILAIEMSPEGPCGWYGRVYNTSSQMRIMQLRFGNLATPFYQLDSTLMAAIEGVPLNRDENREAEAGKIVAELRGKCFNATIAVQKHTVRCPWCPDPSSLAIVEQQYSGNEPSAELAQQIDSHDQLLHIGVIVLSAIAIVSSTAFTCLLVAFLKQKRSSVLLNKQRRFGAYHDHCQQVHVDQFHNAHSDESRYETPWDQKYRPLPYWLGNRNDMTAVSPPMETSSIIGGTLSGHTSRTTVIGTVGRHHHSPNSSVGDQHEDSGLESV